MEFPVLDSAPDATRSCHHEPTDIQADDAHPVLTEVWRGDMVESFHRGAVAVVDADGCLLASLGDIERPIFPRSAVKALQALPVVASGAADAFTIPDEALTMTCASHGGEAEHVRLATAMLANSGLDAGVLECGAHWPTHEPTMRAMVRAGWSISALHNNCSGKHAGFVRLGCSLAGQGDPGAFLRGYVTADHPVMREVTAALQATTASSLPRRRAAPMVARSRPTASRCGAWRWLLRALAAAWV